MKTDPLVWRVFARAEDGWVAIGTGLVVSGPDRVDLIDAQTFESLASLEAPRACLVPNGVQIYGLDAEWSVATVEWLLTGPAPIDRIEGPEASEAHAGGTHDRA